MQLFNDLANFLANPPGNLIYILAVAFTLIGSLQGAISQWRTSGYPQARRLIIGLVVLLAIQLVLFIFSGLMEQIFIQTRSLLPVFDRAALLLSLVWIIWVWAFPEPSRSGDAATILLSLVVLAAGVFGAVALANASSELGQFNVSPQAFFWNLGGILILVLGLVLIIRRKPASWGTGLVLLALVLVGFVWEAISPLPTGDFSGIIRFFTLAGFPLLLTLPNRFSGMESPAPYRRVVPATAADGEQAKQAPIRERRRYSTDPKTLQSLLSLAAQTDPTRVNQFIVRSVAQAMLADLCFLIYIGEDKNSLVIASGYDLIREESLEGGILNKESMPMLSNAILRGKLLKMPASTTSADIKGLVAMLSLSNPGNLLNVPVVSNKNILGSILVLSPYSNRVWNDDDQKILANIIISIVQIIERSRQSQSVQNDRENAQVLASAANEHALNVNTANLALAAELEQVKDQLAQAMAEAGRHKALVEQSNQALSSREQELAASQAANLELTAAGDSKAQLQSELNQTLAEMARLQNQLAQSNDRLLALEKKRTGIISTEQTEVIASISQELRQPMSSIIGYADLLLGESVGILGALQRKFIERIRTSTERIGSLVDDLIQITTIETGLNTVKSEAVDLNMIIDNAMAYTSSQMREKNITLRIDIPDNLKPIEGDRDALQQILIHLLQNAGLATPVEGSIALRVRSQEEDGLEHVLIQVTDLGGGIPQEDLPRVFSRLYRAENALIQGVGDTGVGLSIAKALTDAQGGRIWVETEMGRGSTFSVSLPIKAPHPGQVAQEA